MILNRLISIVIAFFVCTGCSPTTNTYNNTANRNSPNKSVKSIDKKKARRNNRRSSFNNKRNNLKPLLTLPIRISVIRSNKIRELNNILSKRQVQMLINKSNIIWHQAGIRWKVESIVHKQAKAVKKYKTALNPNSSLSKKERNKVMIDVCDINNKLAGGWNLCIVGHMSRKGLGGVYFKNEKLVIWPVSDSKRSLNPTTLAHELGHSLGLPHASNNPDNLMMGGGNNIGRKGRFTKRMLKKIKLTNEEINKSRINARKRLSLIY